MCPEKVTYHFLKQVMLAKDRKGYLYSLFSSYIIEKNTYKAEWFETSYHEFEHQKFRIPLNYDAVLTKLYGDYMTPPNMNERNLCHDVEAYWKE